MCGGEKKIQYIVMKKEKKKEKKKEDHLHYKSHKKDLID